MKKSLLTYFCWFTTALWLASSGLGFAQARKIHPKVWRRRRAQGVIRVIVDLSMPTQLEKKIN